MTEYVTSENSNTDKMDKIDNKDTSDDIPDSIEDGIIQYFSHMNENQRELIQAAIENGMPDMFIRRMFRMNYEKMKQYYDSYFIE